MRLVVKSSVADAVAKLPDSAAAEVIGAFKAIPSAFGRPHLHAGLGIRQLQRGTYEARVNLRLRAIFARMGDTLVVTFLGNHDEVRQYLRR